MTTEHEASQPAAPHSSLDASGDASLNASLDAPLRIGVLGASRIAELAVIDASAHTGDILAAIAARDPKRAETYAAEHGFETVYDSYDALIADDSLDLIYIGLPNGLHAKWAAHALEAGRSVLVEKPFAANLAEFDRVAAYLDSARGWAQEAFHYADHPLIARLLEILQSGEIGELRKVNVHMRMPAPASTDPRWNFDLAGGALMDLGCYAIHALLKIAKVQGAELVLDEVKATSYAPDPRVDASVDAEFTIGAGAGAGAVHASMRVDMESVEWDFGLELIGTEGSAYSPNFVKPQDDDRLTIRTGTGAAATERDEHFGEVPSYVHQLERVRRDVREGVKDREQLAQSRATMALIDAMYTATGLPLRPGHL